MSSRALLYFTALAVWACLLFWPAPGRKPTASQLELLYTLRGHEGQITNIGFSPDGSLLATGSEDQTAKLWDLSTGSLRRTLKGHSGAVGAVAFSPDGRMLATGGGDGTVELWDVASGKLQRSLPRGGYPLAFSPNGRLLAAADGKQIVIWDTRSWKVAAALPEARIPPSPRTSINVGQVAFAPDGKSLATVESVFHSGEPGIPDDFVQLWDTATWQVHRNLHQPIASRIQVTFAPDSHCLAVAGGWNVRGDVLLWNVVIGEVRPLATGMEDQVSSIVYDPKGRWVAFESGAGATFVDVTTGKQLLVLKLGGTVFGIDQELALSPDGRLLGAAREDGTLEIWRLPADLAGGSAAARANTPAAAGPAP